MTAFFLFVRLRLAELWRKPLSGFLYLVLPVILLLLTALVFWNGHPFERRQVLLLGDKTPPALEAQLASFSDLSVQRPEVKLLDAALEQIRSRAVSAVLVCGLGCDLYVSDRDALFGRGLASVLPEAKVHYLETPRWGYVRYLFPGFLALSVLFSSLLGMGHSLVKYRQNLFLKKLATTPMSKASFIGAQLFARSLLVLAQSLVLIVVAALLFDLPMFSGRLLLALLCIFLGLLVFTGVGFLLACVIKTEEIFLDLLNMIVSPTIFFSEIFFPASVLPGPLPWVAELIPSTQLVRVLRSVLLYGDWQTSTFLIQILWLMGWAVVVYAVSIWRFRWYE
jgi:ABC-2 type transport system permease protein